MSEFISHEFEGREQTLLSLMVQFITYSCSAHQIYAVHEQIKWVCTKRCV